MRSRSLVTFPPVSFALGAALLFGASTPVAKLLLGHVDPILLAGLFYVGSGSGLALWWALRWWWQGGHSPEAGIQRADLPWLVGAIVAGGVAGPVLLMVGLTRTPASTASLLLNLEGVFTAALAWAIFKEHLGRRLVLGMAAITAGSLMLSWVSRPEFGVSWGALAIVGACLAWAIDNNLTRQVSAGDPLQIAGAKGLIAGLVNLTIAFTAGAHLPDLLTMLSAAVVGFLGYGVSLVLFVLALRHLGTARTGAYFSFAPFIGAALSLLLFGEHPTVRFLIAAVLMGTGVWLHLTERHAHEHWHEPLEHTHRHVYDEHHRHGQSKEPHSHSHTHHEDLHIHPHYPDIHHHHEH